MIQIYKIENISNGKVYIGKHEGDIFKDNYWGSGNNIKHALSKYGKAHFTREILNTVENNWEVQEIFWISIFDCKAPKGYNISSGGKGADSGKNHPMYGRIGDKNPMYGRTGEKSGMYGRVGSKHPMYGVHKFGIDSPGLRKKVNIFLEGTKLATAHIFELCETYNLSPQCISHCLHNRNKTHKNYSFKYADEEAE